MYPIAQNLPFIEIYCIGSEWSSHRVDPDSVLDSNDWSGCWGKHMKSVCFQSLKEYQKLNHFPGTFQIGRKDRLWKNLQRLMVKYGHKECVLYLCVVFFY